MATDKHSRLDSKAALHDLTGRARLVRNVSTSYLSHLVFVIFGFVLPRTIDEYIGQTALGIWDFGWAFVNYLSLAMVGIGSSVNRFVARYRTSHDNLALNRLVSTVVLIQVLIAAGVFVATAILAYFVPLLYAERLGEYGDVARWVVLFLGSALAVEMLFDAWRGVLSGCHRWDIYNALNAGGYTIASLAMIAALAAGGGLKSMAAVYFLCTLATEVLRYYLARKTCPELEIARKFANWRDAKEVTRFGIKTVLIGLNVILTTQTVNVLVVAHLGPAALAILARPIALVRHVGTLASKYANVLTPTVGSLQSQGNTAVLKAFALQNARLGWLIAIPPLLLLAIVGDLLVGLWMGPGYADWSVALILAAGHILPVAQRPLLHVLIGMNAHGKVAKYSAVAAVIILTAGIVLVNTTGWTLSKAAWLVILPGAVSLGVIVLTQSIRVLEISLAEYWHDVFSDALRLLLVSGTGLVAIRVYLPIAEVPMMLLSAAYVVAVFMILHHADVSRFLKAVRK